MAIHFIAQGEAIPPKDSGREESPSRDDDSHPELIVHRRNRRGMFTTLHPNDRQLFLPFRRLVG
jgi:hypothetical protein